MSKTVTKSAELVVRNNLNSQIKQTLVLPEGINYLFKGSKNESVELRLVGKLFAPTQI